MSFFPKVLVIGIGSIGARHVNNLLNLGYGNITLVTRRKDFSKDWPELTVFESLESALAQGEFTHAVISSPTSRHITDLNLVLKAGIKYVFLEKPLSHSWENVDEVIQQISPEHKISLGFDLRFDPGLMKVQELIRSGVIGPVFSAVAFVGQYLPDWRPHEDYRLGSSAKISAGGGVLLDLVHEFDYLHWLLGKAKMIGAFYQNSHSLEIETEDLADVLIKFESGAQATVHLDYLQKKLVRYCHLTGAGGIIRWDLAQRMVCITKINGEEKTWDFSQHERNDRFVKIIKAFIENTQEENLASLPDGLSSLKMVLAAKKSSETSTFVHLS
ncbi:Gfo/Idh/MocA family protein [Algoriphagus mannitolivorans]|uniref:Gfo/Idh/MocA family protein n=1 Tax=Algoriphagus mannitolivorans TaxID=226504 RepID=UPI0003FC0950|nr:Gfo/Idh/MocA family oxidoreductase [Algoriphagus mannitolivorans]